MVFSEPGTVHIEVTFDNRGQLYLRQALSLGHRFFGYHGTGQKNHIIVDVEEIIKIVEWYYETKRND